MISCSSTPYAILGKMFKLKLYIIPPILLPYQPHSSRCYFCGLCFCMYPYIALEAVASDNGLVLGIVKASYLKAPKKLNRSK